MILSLLLKNLHKPVADHQLDRFMRYQTTLQRQLATAIAITGPQ
jgi:hypothetical protein